MKQKIRITVLALLFLFNILLLPSVHCQINLDSSLVAYYPFNGGASDEGSFLIDGIVNNAILTTGVLQDNEGAYSFDGSSSFIDCGEENRNITNKLTLSAFIKTNSSEVMDLINKYNWGEDKGYHLQINEGYARIGGRDNSGSYHTTGHSITAVNDNNWHHLIAIINENTWQIWVDCNMEVEINTPTNLPNLANTAHFSIGNDSYEGDQFFNGTIDEVRLYNRVLNIDEIKAICNFQVTNVEKVSVESKSLNIYPNPTNNLLNIELPKYSEGTKAEIIDVNGKVIFSKEILSNREQLNLSKLTKGIYFIRLQFRKTMLIEKIIIL